MWFAFILVSLNHWKQQPNLIHCFGYVVICFHFSIFEPLETATKTRILMWHWLWFAFILVSLNHWKQLDRRGRELEKVVICFHFSIFEPLETAKPLNNTMTKLLWFAFILVSLNHWKQLTETFVAKENGCDLLSF